jgi:hypothetical protein
VTPCGVSESSSACIFREMLLYKSDYEIRMKELLYSKYNNNNFVALVRERTIPIDRPPLVDDVSDNFCG